jgi:hypothetical protein
MPEPAGTEGEQELSFNQSACGATKGQRCHMQWAEAVAEDSNLNSFNTGSDFDTTHQGLLYQSSLSSSDEKGEIKDGSDREDYNKLALTRSPSHFAQPRFNLSEDEHILPSPLRRALPYAAPSSNPTTGKHVRFSITLYRGWQTTHLGRIDAHQARLSPREMPSSSGTRLDS